MARRIITLVFVVGVIVTFFLKPQSKSNEVLGMPNFTVITRTSTPKPATPIPPTSTRSDNGGGSNPPPPQATETAVLPTITPTSTLIPVTLVATPIGGFVPTAVACGFPPTVQAKNTTYIRMGPGTDYEITGQLTYLETRPIVGRAANAEWWIIQLTNNETGWVANTVVNVSGNTSGIPIQPAPAMNGTDPTPGPLWNPTPNPECPTITPSATPVPTETATNTPKPTATATPMPTETATTESLAEEAANLASEPTATATSVVPSGAETAEALAAVEPTTIQPTAQPLDTEDAPSAVSVLPCAPALIGLAVIGFLAFRRIF